MTVTQIFWTATSPTPLRVLTRPSAVRAEAPKPAVCEVLMTIKDVAAACSLSETAIRRATSDGELPAVKLRSRLRINRTDFDALIASQRQSPARSIATPRSATRARRPVPAGSFRALAHADLREELRG